ncbi:MAG: nitrogen fixation protein NifZ [Candidatus Dactylopiibacterium carminicum]|uniref:Nitrogen fixation protein NifZ n=1 Tax=Candidatus Dactylopiibacterium carminicum TaxID=857335 RepID=A0A272EXJ2_9RHOO|nr:nitrogen fixation protein NifZ [Candidatus Dactylopiibacterium carminicum]PAS94833.1 MAG: nitrogen fixation protein NifZ [Candidatus Dactylopiibacterium carminicum]PAS97757.1 MAG: nitrogen fixation protein NifZ [Candidatus Dactylopiibacterium carminicum]PAT00235.1 MAG: nitrogen fixation protein NifZ [Candidatus Dactylopiibacterium carminicum]
MRTKWQIGDSLRVTRNVRDDGTFPGAFRGDLLVRRGRVGHVVDIGTFLFDQIIYSLHFIEEDRVVACREEELIGLDEPWAESRFETRERVLSARALSIDGEVRVPVGATGEILKVLRDVPGGVAYHVHFECLPGRPLIVRETALDEVAEKEARIENTHA